MEFQKIKPRRTVCFRSKQVIMELLEKYESLKGKTSRYLDELCSLIVPRLD